MKAADKINKDEEKIKIIYGVEAYFMDDLVESVKGDADTGFDGTFICFDIETTGLSAARDKITEIGAVKVENGVITDTFFFNLCKSRNADSAENHSAYRHYR